MLYLLTGTLSTPEKEGLERRGSMPPHPNGTGEGRGGPADGAQGGSGGGMV